MIGCRVSVERSCVASRPQVTGELIATPWPRHVKPRVGGFLQGGRGLSQSIVGIVVRFRLEWRVVLWLEGVVWLAEKGQAIWSVNTGQQRRAQTLGTKTKERNNKVGEVGARGGGG